MRVGFLVLYSQFNNQYINRRCAEGVAHRAVSEQELPTAVVGLKGHLNQLAQLRLNLTGQLRHDAIVIGDADGTVRIGKVNAIAGVINASIPAC